MEGILLISELLGPGLKVKPFKKKGGGEGERAVKMWLKHVGELGASAPVRLFGSVYLGA